jgi:hypothetical protein
MVSWAGNLKVELVGYTINRTQSYLVTGLITGVWPGSRMLWYTNYDHAVTAKSGCVLACKISHCRLSRDRMRSQFCGEFHHTVCARL